MKFCVILLLTLFAFPGIVYAENMPEDTGLLWLVNRDNKLCEKFRPGDIVSFDGVELREGARDAFVEMITAMKAEGAGSVRLQSGYRAYAHQRAVFEGKVGELVAKGKSRGVATAIASRSVQVPGASEHQLGLALDVSVGGKLSQSFAETDEGRWLAENCHRFGFVIRYPKEKTDITNIIYEPWHLRYVGAPHAEIMRQTGKTLEEYHEFLMEIDMYVVWGKEEYFLVKYSSAPPNAPGITDAPQTGENAALGVTFSSTRAGAGAGYIITMIKALEET